MRSYEILVRATVEAESADDAANVVPALFIREGLDVFSVCGLGGLVGLDVLPKIADCGPAAFYDSNDLVLARAAVGF